MLDTHRLRVLVMQLRRGRQKAFTLLDGLLRLLSDSWPPFFAEPFERAGGGGEVEFLLGPPHLICLHSNVVEGVFELFRVREKARYFFTCRNLGCEAWLLIFDGHAATELSLQKRLRLVDFKFPNRSALLQEAPAAQLIGFEGWLWLRGMAENFPTCLNCTRSPSLHSAAPVQQL